MEAERGSSPTSSTQEVLRRMSLNSPPARADNPRVVKRAKLLADEAPTSRAFAVPKMVAHTPAPPTVRKLLPPSARAAAAALDGPSPMPSWGVNLRDASAGEILEAGDDNDPSSLYPSFQLDCLRQPYGEPSSDTSAASGGELSRSRDGSSTSTAMDEDQEDYQDNEYDHRGGLLRSATGAASDGTDDDGDDDEHAPSPCPARLEMSGGGRRRAGSGGTRGFAAALEEARGEIPETPFRRPGSVARTTVPGRGGGGSCSPVGGYSGLDSSDPQGSPVKRRSVGRWRLSEEGRRETAVEAEADRRKSTGMAKDSLLRSNRNPFSPDGDGRGGGAMFHEQGDAMAMPAPAPRARLAAHGPSSSLMDTGDGVHCGELSAGRGGADAKGDEDSFLRRVSLGSRASVPTTGGKKTAQDATKPSPCDIAAFVPVTPCRNLHDDPVNGRISDMAAAAGSGSGSGSGSGDGDDAPMSPVSGAGGGIDVHGETGDRGGGGRGRFATDFEVKEVIGTGSFGTVYKVRSRVDGCLYAVKCSRRRFKGESDRQNMLMEVYALAALCDSAQETINIVRYHQAWIEDERLYIQTELCDTSLEKQLESGQRLEINDVYAFLRQTLLGLEILHQHKLVHLDIKPGNIFVKNRQYKLGDFGLVTPVHVRSGADVVEGDSRYMSKELLNDDHSNLTKCDVFSLGITLYEIISGRPLPPNGDEWHRLRSGKAGMPMGLPADLSTTLRQMMDPDPSRRPSAAELLRYPCLQSEMEKQLNDQRSKLNKERTRNSGLLEEVSALIQKQSQRSGRLSRTITWDNSYFAANGVKGASLGGSNAAEPPQAIKARGGTPDHFHARGAGGGGSGGISGGAPRFDHSHNTKPSGYFGGGTGATVSVASSLSSLLEREEDEAAAAAAAESPAAAVSVVSSTGGNGRGLGGGGQPASFERLKQAKR